MRFAVFGAVALATALTISADDPARIYVYARRDTAAHSWLSISRGGVVVAELKQGMFFAIKVEPGQSTLFIENGIPLSVNGRSGEELFIRLDWNYGIDRPPIPVLSKVQQSEARREMKNLSYIGEKRMHSKLVPKTDPSGDLQPMLHTRDKE